MVRRGGREALEIRSKIGEHERQSVILQLATQWRHSNLVTLVMVREENHSGEA